MLGTSPGFGLDPAQDLLQYNCQSWTRQSGLPVNGVKTITQSKDGYLWLGSTLGLVRFDGIDFSLVDLAGVPGIRGTIVNSVAPANDGGIWVGLENGSFGHYDGKTFSLRGGAARGGLSLNVHTLTETADGTLWVAAQREAARITPAGKYEPMMTFTESFQMYILFHFADSRDRHWIVTADQGVFCWQEGKLAPFESPGPGTVLCMAEDREGNLWFGTSSGLYCLDANLQPKPIAPLSGAVRSLLVDRRGTLWIGTDTLGLGRREGGSYRFLKKSDGLASDDVTALAEDSEGDLWVGAISGLSKLSDVKFETARLGVGDDRTVGSAAVTTSSRGGAWVACPPGIMRIDGADRQIYGKDAGLPDGPVKRLFEARNGDVYFVSGLTTLSILSGDRVVAVHPAPTLVVGMVEDAASVVVSVGATLQRASRDSLVPYVFAAGAPDFKWILNLAPGRDGAVWVASENGIFRVQDGTFRHWSVAEGLPDPTVRTIIEDVDGVVWASTLTGVVRLRDGQVSVITRKDGLFDDNIYAIQPDDLGNLWIDSGRGIFRVSRASMNDFADARTKRVECQAYDGLDSVRMSDKTIVQERVGCKTPDGRIWFPSACGVVIIDPTHIAGNRNPPVVHIDRFLADGAEMDPGLPAVVPPGHGGLEFHFVALSLPAPLRVKVRYRLEGYEPNWVETDSRRAAFYTNLPPGHYVFRVTARNSDGVWNGTGDSLSVELRPQIYQTWWCRALGGGAVLAALGVAYLRRGRLVQQKQRALLAARVELEAQVVRRTSELAGANASLEAAIQGHRQTEAQLQHETILLGREIEERKRMEVEIRRVHRELVAISRQAGMAEVATGVLHNVGNVLNSVNVSAIVVSDRVRQSKAGSIAKLAALFEEHKADVAGFMTNDARGRMVPAYLAALADSIAGEQALIGTELAHLRKNIEHIKEIVGMQQSQARNSGFIETVALEELVEDALRMEAASLARHHIELVRDYRIRPEIDTDKHKIVQILVNLVRNARFACREGGRPDGRITVGIEGDAGKVRVSVGDNGVGIPAENLARVFNHGFTTRKDGHGFGLHSGALAAKEIGGSLQVHSDGPGRGATFTLELPGQPAVARPIPPQPADVGGPRTA